MSTHPPASAHGELQPIFDDIWLLQGQIRMGPGVTIPRNMVVIRDQGELTLLNAVRMDGAGLAALEALGQVRRVLKIGTHGMDDAFYVERYGAQRWALPAVTDPGVSHHLGVDELPIAWLELFVFEHPTSPEAALLADRDGGVLLTCDAVQHWPDLDGCSVLARPVALALGFRKRVACIGPPWLKSKTPKGGSLEPDFRGLLKLPFRHVIGAHGKLLREVAKQELMSTVEAVF